MATCSLPHVRGGVSDMITATVTTPRSSPRPWGCFHVVEDTGFFDNVFPTSVGVFLTMRHQFGQGQGLPHVRGGVSHQDWPPPGFLMSSPRPWRCFRYKRASL